MGPPVPLPPPRRPRTGAAVASRSSVTAWRSGHWPCVTTRRGHLSLSKQTEARRLINVVVLIVEHVSILGVAVAAISCPKFALFEGHQMLTLAGSDFSCWDLFHSFYLNYTVNCCFVPYHGLGANQFQSCVLVGLGSILDYFSLDHYKTGIS